MPNKSIVGFVFVTLLIDSIGFGIILPVLPQLIMGVTGESIASAAVYGGWMMMVYALMQFLFSTVMGNVSDRFGRRPVLLLTPPARCSRCANARWCWALLGSIFSS